MVYDATKIENAGHITHIGDDVVGIIVANGKMRRTIKMENVRHGKPKGRNPSLSEAMERSGFSESKIIQLAESNGLTVEQAVAGILE